MQPIRSYLFWYLKSIIERKITGPVHFFMREHPSTLDKIEFNYILNGF